MTTGDIILVDINGQYEFALLELTANGNYESFRTLSGRALGGRRVDDRIGGYQCVCATGTESGYADAVERLRA